MKYLIVLFLFFSIHIFSQTKILWIDPSANFYRLINDDSLELILKNAKDCSIDIIALGVKKLSGEVLFESNFAPKVPMPNNINVIQNVLDKGNKYNLKIYPVFEVFPEGIKTTKTGVVYDKHPELQSYVYDTLDGIPQIIKITDWKFGIPAFINPLLPESQKYELDILKELITKYDFEGIIFDRFRFNGINSDFSESTKNRFIEFLKNDLKMKNNDLHFPKDIYELKITDGIKKIVEGKYYKEWLYFRSLKIKQIMIFYINTLRKIKPEIKFANYVGSWYPSYYEYGVNWASDNFIGNYDWWYKDYNKTGYAELLDWITVGCYYPQILKNDALKIGKRDFESIEGGCEISNKAIMQVIPLFAAIYVRDFKDNPEKFIEAVQMGINKTDGITIFDVSQIIEYNWWDILKQALKK